MKLTRFLSGAAIAALLATPVATIPTEGWAQVDIITVTTRKREENLQDVPIAVNAFDFQTIDRKGIDSIDDVARLTPGLQFDDGISPQDVRIVIRGLSPTRGRQNAAVLIDGVDLSSEGIQTAGASLVVNPRLFDVERIEVVKGPQNALYGRSAFAGAIHYVTKKPGDEFEARFGMDVGTHDQREFSVRVAGPVVEDVLSLGLNAAYWNHDGFYKSSFTGEDVGGNEGAGISGSAALTISEGFSFDARVEYSEDDFDERPRFAFRSLAPENIMPLPAAAITPVPGALGPQTSVINNFSPSFTMPTDLAASAFLGGSLGFFPTPVGPIPDADSVVASVAPDPRTGRLRSGTDRDIFRIQLNGSWDLGLGTLETITHYGEVDFFQFGDTQNNTDCTDVVPAVTFQFVSWCGERRLDVSNELLSQEVRFSGETGPFNWLVGGLYWNEKVTHVDNAIAAFSIGVLAPPPLTGADVLTGLVPPTDQRTFMRDTRHLSAFVMAEWEATDQWSLIFEGRYTDDKQDVSGPQPGIGAGGIAISVCAFCFGMQTIPPATPQGVTAFATVSDSFFSPKGTIQWTPNDDLLFYATVAKAQKPAGIALLGFSLAADNNRFEAEKMLSYEIGAKTSWLDNTVQLNGAVYYEDFTDKQTFTQEVDPNSGFIQGFPINASAASIFGVEFDALWQPAEEVLGGFWTFGASYSFIDATYDEFLFNSAGIINIAQSGQCTPVLVLPAPPLCQIDLSGNQLEDVAKHSFSGSASFRRPLGNSGLTGTIGTDFQFVGKRFDDQFNSFTYDSYWLVDLRGGVEGENWSLIAYADNLLNDGTVRSGIQSVDFGTLQTPTIVANQVFLNLPNRRQVGVRGSINF